LASDGSAAEAQPAENTLIFRAKLRSGNSIKCLVSSAELLPAKSARQSFLKTVFRWLSSITGRFFPAIVCSFQKITTKRWAICRRNLSGRSSKTCNYWREQLNLRSLARALSWQWTIVLAKVCRICTCISCRAAKKMAWKVFSGRETSTKTKKSFSTCKT